MNGSFPEDRRAVALAPAVAALTGALLRSWSRNAPMAVQAVVFPAFLLFVFDTVLGATVSRMGGGDSIEGTAALIALVSVMQGSLVAAVFVTRDRDSGLLDRQWTLPLPRGAYLASRVLAEFLRGLASTVVLLLVAVALGLRFGGGPGPLIAAVTLAAGFGVACSMFVLALSARTDEKTVLMVFGAVFLLALFFNTGFAPAAAYPGWLQPVVEHQPMSPAIEAMRAFFRGGVDGAATATAVTWCAGLILIFGWWANRSLASVIGDRR